jgi:hypothetical protein
VYDGNEKDYKKQKMVKLPPISGEEPQVLYEENSNSSATYIYGPTGRIAKRITVNQETNTFYYHKDHLRSTRLVTDESQNVVTEAMYKPFGDSLIHCMIGHK